MAPGLNKKGEELVIEAYYKLYAMGFEATLSSLYSAILNHVLSSTKLSNKYIG